jgi:ureidoacrylate peracid hydrolase
MLGGSAWLLALFVGPPRGLAAGAEAGSGGNAPAALLPAKPRPLALDPAKSAVIVVDMTNDFGSKGGMFDLMGLDLTGIQKAVAPTAKVLAAARQAGMKIIYLKMAHKVAAPGPDGGPHTELIRDDWNTEVLPDLKPAPGDPQIYKPRFSGFFKTELDDVLKKMGVRQLVFTGCTTSVCVESTLRDAAFRDYACVLLADCTAEPCGAEFPRSNHEATLYLVEHRFGYVSDSAEFLQALAAMAATH